MLHPYLTPDEIIPTVIEVTTVRDFWLTSSLSRLNHCRTGNKGQAFSSSASHAALFLVNADHGADYNQ
jgi:hypothetical protein